jgi:hypothetical protein
MKWMEAQIEGKTTERNVWGYDPPESHIKDVSGTTVRRDGRRERGTGRGRVGGVVPQFCPICCFVYF